VNAVAEYASAVDRGQIIAGPSVRGECARFLRDLREGEERGLIFDEEAANRALRFFPAILTVEADDEAVPFHLINWQQFVIGSLFGWKMWDPTRGKLVRRFREAYIETGKGSGKSPLAAGVGLYCMIADGVASAEVYAAATIKQQAMILFNDATKMIKRSPALQDRLTKSGGNPIWQWKHEESDSIFKPLSQDEMVSGPRPNCALVDEYHEHKTAHAYDMLKAGFKGRENPLLFVITNSGSDRTTPCGEQHDFAKQIARGELDPNEFQSIDRVFTFISDLDDDDDPLNDEKCWPKANPSLGITIKPEYLRSQVQTAKDQPSKQNTILRLNFCRWTDAAGAWISREIWTACETEEDLDAKHEGDPCYGGLDLSFTTDMTAFARCWPWFDDEGRINYDIVVDQWRPKDGLQSAIDRDRVRYDLWAEQGHLFLSPGKVIKMIPVAERMAWAQDRFDLKSIAYDNYRHKELDQNLQDEGFQIPLIEHPQGFRRAKMYDVNNEPVKDPMTGKHMDNPMWMPSSVQETENALIEGRIRIKVNPVLRWNVGGVVVREDPAGTDNRIFDKRKSTIRIDGVVALAMSVGCAKSALSVPKAPVSPYEDPEFSLV
jgi:phage terminase large subunit-like protein